MFYDSVWLKDPTQIEGSLSERRAFVMKKCRILVLVRSREMLLQCESKNPPPRGYDIFSFFSQTVENF